MTEHAMTSALTRALDAIRVAKVALETALEEGLKRGIERRFKASSPTRIYRHEHRPGRIAKLAADPELRAHVEARYGTMTFDQIAASVAETFPPDRQVRRSAIHAWWSRHHKPTIRKRQ